MAEQEPWHPSALNLVMAGLAPLMSLALAVAITVRAVRFFTLDSILPTLFIVQAWLPLIANGVALRAVMLNRRQPRPRHRRTFTTAMTWWFFLMLSAAYAGTGTLDVFG